MEGVLLSKANGDVRIFLKERKKKKVYRLSRAVGKEDRRKRQDVMVEAEAAR